MKKIYKSSLLLLLMCSIASLSFGQEKKTEQKVKVVIDDGTGQKTIIDTTFTGGTTPESITLKNGKMIFIGESGEDMEIGEPGKGAKQVFVTVKTDDNGDKSEEKKIIIMSSDSVNLTAEPGDKGKRMYVYSNSPGKEGKSGTQVIVTGKGTSETQWKDINGDKVIIISDGDKKKDNEKSYTIHYSKKDSDKDTEMNSKYVIAKDGVVVTVESNDEAKAKKLIRKIEKRLDGKNNAHSKKERNKTDKNKTDKNKTVKK
jgi:hypothetical protein